MAVDLRQMRYFVAIADDGQISSAARRLHVAQPALSQALRRLEADLGVRLLERHPRGVALTDSGAEFLARAREVLAAADAAVAATRHAAPRVQARLRIGFIPPVVDIAGDLVEDYRAENRDVEITWEPLDFGSQEHKLRAGDVDVAFLWVPREDPELAFTVVGKEPRAAVMSTHHRLAARSELSYDDVGNEPHPAAPRDAPAAWTDFWYLADVRGRRPRVITTESRSVEQTWALVASGRAITTAPLSLARHYARGGVVAKPIRDVPPAVLTVAHRKRDANPAVSAFVAYAGGQA